MLRPQPLQTIHPVLRQPLLNYVYEGVLPSQFPALVSALAGDMDDAIEQCTCDEGPAIIREAVEAAEALCDICLGHPAYVLRWISHRGLSGRQA